MRYKFSFTALGLSPVAMQGVAALYRDCGTWRGVYGRVVKENTLQCRTKSSAKRIASEIVHRLACLSDAEVGRFLGCAAPERPLFAWLAVCRCFAMVGDLARESLREAYVSGAKTYGRADYERFVNSKLPLHPELDGITDKTYGKVREVIFRMMREAGFLDAKQNIIPAVMDRSLTAFFPKRDLAFFPMFMGVD